MTSTPSLDTTPTPADGGTPDAPRTRAGYVTLVGRPNVGKSTLLNAVVGAQLSIVTPKAQTTWQRVTGIHTAEDVQMIFLDTPGLLRVRDLHQRAMLGAAREALEEADVVLLVLDATRKLLDEERRLLVAELDATVAPVLAAINKIDAAPDTRVEELASWAEEALRARPFPISALREEGIESLRTAVEEALPRGPFLYPPDHLASQPVRFFVGEMVRETVFEQFHEEVPYSVMTSVEAFREGEEPVYIGVDVYVERASQKGILVGKGGAAIRGLGQAAREKIEHFLGRSVYLDLWVKVLPGWRRKKASLERFGFRVPQDEP